MPDVCKRLYLRPNRLFIKCAIPFSVNLYFSDSICISFLFILAVNNVGMSYSSPYYLLEVPDREEVRNKEIF